MEKSTGGQLYYTGAQDRIRTASLATKLSEGLGYAGQTKPVDMDELIGLLSNPFLAEFGSRNNQSSVAKAREVLGWKPRHIDMLTAIAIPAGL